jgi:hypothetical protein
VGEAASPQVDRADSHRIRALKAVIALACLSSFALAPRLWLSGRTYPTAPVWPWLPPVPAPLDAIWFSSLWILLGLMLVEGSRRLCAGLFLALTVLLMLWDQGRWQPPIYQYVLLLAALTVYPVRADPTARDRALQTARLIIAATYFWSGVQKINATFVGRVFPWMIEPIVAGWPAGLRSLASSMGAVVPVLEVAIALGLLSRRFRGAAVLTAVTMHGVILLAIGPLGRRWDHFVWPWNVAMAVSVIILFARSRDHDLSTLREVTRPAYGKLLLVLVGVMPAASFTGMWDSYLSWSLYSGNLSDAVIRFRDPEVAGLPESVRARIKRRISGEHVLDIFMWSVHDVGLEPYPEPRVYRHVARWICHQVSDPTGIRLIIWTRPAILDGRREETTYSCGEL